MKNFLKKLARFSLKHPALGNYKLYWLVVILIGVVTIATYGYSVNPISWRSDEVARPMAIMGFFFLALFLFFFFLPILVDSEKGDLPELVIPQIHDIRSENPQYHRIIDRLIRIAINDDDANLLRQWISFFRQKKSTEERMASFEMQFLSKG